MTSNQRIAFVGAGAIGGFVGAHLYKAGFDVTLVDQWPEHVDSIKRDGLRFTGTSGEYSIKVPALHLHEAPSLAEKPVDIAFICTKLYDTEWAAGLAKQYVAQSGIVVTMQNGLVEELVASIVGAERTLGCIASTLSVDAHQPGHIARTRQPGGGAYTIFRAGELHGRITPRLQNLVAVLGTVDSAKATNNLRGERWSKLVANTMTTGVSGVTGLSLKALHERDDTRTLMIKLGAEAIALGRALGYAIEPVRKLDDEVWIKAAAGDRAARDAIDRATDVELQRLTDESFSGTAQDIRKGRRTENDFMNGYVARKARDVGLSAPTHEALAELVRRVERGETGQDPAHVSRLLQERNAA